MFLTGQKIQRDILKALPKTCLLVEPYKIQMLGSVRQYPNRTWCLIQNAKETQWLSLINGPKARCDKRSMNPSDASYLWIKTKQSTMQELQLNKLPESIYEKYKGNLNKPALQEAGGSFCRSFNSFWILLEAITKLLQPLTIYFHCRKTKPKPIQEHINRTSRPSLKKFAIRDTISKLSPKQWDQIKISNFNRSILSFDQKIRHLCTWNQKKYY